MKNRLFDDERGMPVVHTFNEVIDDLLQRMQTREGREELQEYERSFRRGWHHGWDYACTTIFDLLMKEGMSIPESHRLICDFENETVMEWRRDLLLRGTPTFRLDEMRRAQAVESSTPEDDA